MTISKFSAASVTATIFMAAFSTATMAGTFGPDVVPATTVVTFEQPGVSGHVLTPQEGLQPSIADNTLVATGVVTTVANGQVGLRWTTGIQSSGRDYSFRTIQRTDGPATEYLRVNATGVSVDGTYQNESLYLTADGAGSATYYIRFSTTGSPGALVAGNYTIGMNAATYTP